MRLSLLGRPGAGKGTQGARLARHLGVPLIATGELLRQRAASGDAPELAELLVLGKLVPDDVVTAIADDALASPSAAGGYVLDGYPRTLAQARHADALDLDAVVHLDVPEEVSRRRIAGRADPHRSDDARPDTTEERLRTFEAETEPVLDHYRRRGLLVSIDGARPPDEVTEAILRELALPGGGKAG
jgi:adenylate kinase